MKAAVIGFDPLYRALYFWLDEWSRAAKRAITRRDWLVSLGLAKRRRPGSAAESDASDPSEPTEANANIGLLTGCENVNVLWVTSTFMITGATLGMP